MTEVFPCQENYHSVTIQSIPFGHLLFGNAVRHSLPMDKADIRRTQLQVVCDQKFKGNQARLAEAIDREPNLVSRMLRGGKGIGEDMARHIESRLGLPRYWLDGLSGPTASAEPLAPIVISITPSMVLAQISGLLKPMGLKLDDLVQDREATLRHLAARLAGQDEQQESASDTGSMIAQTALTGGDKRGKRRSTA